MINWSKTVGRVRDTKLVIAHRQADSSITPKTFVLWGYRYWLQAFSPYLTVFSKEFFLRIVKTQDCMVKGEELIQSRVRKNVVFEADLYFNLISVSH